MTEVRRLGTGEFPDIRRRTLRPARPAAARSVAGNQPIQRIRLRTARRLQVRRRRDGAAPDRPLQARLLRHGGQAIRQADKSEGGRSQPADPDSRDATQVKAGTATRGTGGWDKAMRAAKQQAEDYARALPKEHGWPPFILVVDVGYVIEVYADFSGQGV